MSQATIDLNVYEACVNVPSSKSHHYLRVFSGNKFSIINALTGDLVWRGRAGNWAGSFFSRA
jgi:hypothetical protein